MQSLKLVLDTNVVLDWLVFNRADVNPLRQAVVAGRITLLTSAPATEELRLILTYPQLKLDTARQQEVLERYRASTVPGAVPEGFSRENLMLPPQFPRCRDRSDGHFVALAHHAGADALVSKDKVVLKMAKRTKKFGLKIIEPRYLAQLYDEPALTMA